MKCPNCSAEIGRFDLAPNCKTCGVNIFYSQQKKFLAEDAKKCELEYATFRILIAKLKTTFIGGIIQILRIVAMVVAIGSIFVPFATVSTNLPVISSKFSFGAWGIYSAFSDGTLLALFNISQYAPKQVGFAVALLVLMVLIFLMGLAVFISLVLSFISIRKTAKVMKTLSVIGGAFCIAAAIVSVLMPSVMAESSFLSATTGVGSFGCFLVFVLIFILNYLVIKKNIQPEIKEVDLQRVEMRKRVKAGQVSLDDLPLPVFESDEERAKRLEEEEKADHITQVAKGGGRVE